MAALLCALPATPALADLTKADNATALQTASSYVENTTPTASDILIFNNTLSANGTFSAGSFSPKGLRVTNPGLDIVINQSNGTTLSLTNPDTAAPSHVSIDMSTATKNLTINGGNAAATLRVKGASSGVTVGNTTFSIGSGSTLSIQTNLTYNNQANGTSTIHLTGAGNFTVGGTNGRITDKSVGLQLTAVSLDSTWSGIATFSNAGTYSGGTTIAGGTLIAGNAGALGGGAVTVSGGTLDLDGSSIVDLTLAANKDFSFSGVGSTLKFNLGASSDQITGNAGGAGTGKFSLTGGTFEFSLGSGFSYSSTYQLFEGFDSGTSIVSGLAFTGFDTGSYQAILNTAGQLSFVPTSVPEPSSFAALAGGLALAAGVGRRRRAVRVG